MTDTSGNTEIDTKPPPRSPGPWTRVVWVTGKDGVVVHVDQLLEKLQKWRIRELLRNLR